MKKFKLEFELEVNGRYVTLNFKLYDDDSPLPAEFLGYAEIKISKLIELGKENKNIN